MPTPFLQKRASIFSRLHGFTLVELLILMGILVLLITWVIPSLENFVNGQRAATQVNQFVTDLQRTRVTAISGKSPVTLCKSTVSRACADTPNGDNCRCVTGGDWSQGWVMFKDSDNDNVIDSDERVLWLHEGLGGAATLVGNRNVRNRVKYNALGQASGYNGTLVLCPSGRFDISTRVIVVSAVGRVRSGPASEFSIASCSP